MQALRLQYTLNDDDAKMYSAYPVAWRDNAPALDKDALDLLYASGKTNGDPEVQAIMMASVPQFSIAGLMDPLVAERAIADGASSGGMLWTTTSPATPTTNVFLLWAADIKFAILEDLEEADPVEPIGPEQPADPGTDPTPPTIATGLAEGVPGTGTSIIY